MSLLAKWISVVSLLGVLSASSGAIAQGDDMARAKEAYSRGQGHFDAGEYLLAREAFEESFDAFPHFRTIFNLALCSEKLGEIASAVDLYHRYVDWSGEVPNREEVLRKIAKLEAMLPPPAATPAEDDEDVGAEDESGAGVVEVTPEQGPDLRVPGWVTTAVGAAAVIAGGVFLGLAQREKREIEGVDGVPYEPSKHDAMLEKGEAFEKAGWISGGVGVAAIAAGIVMLLVSDDPKERDRIETEAVALDGGAAVSVGWRF